ncbi:uncharacterized protein LOC125334894 [Corvus hawaiiensis]|uniref:uncharacterized protein LOC125334894 n=1 Tax=Corvus hawaiiensis TaxID=134902 RepID=UPI0020190BAD|nr:uncharacterized protein LOC125334894 [Corvus hawaiiensis]XP_048178077.1 uncharacterized protein LOC125334894 [Corvus hawaiiensis]
MGTGQSKEISKVSLFGCVLAHWKEIVGTGGPENKRTLVKYCTQWGSLYKLEDGAKWPPNGTLDYNTLLQLMLLLRREGKWEEVSYTDAFFSLRNHPEWQRDCGIKPPSDPMVLALEKENKKGRGRIKQCCSSCSIDQRCTRSDKVYQAAAQGQDDDELTDLLKPPLRRQEEDADSEGTPTPTPSPPGSPVSSRTRKQAPLREAVAPDGNTMLIRVPFSTADLDAWYNVAKNYRSDPAGTAECLQLIIKQHNPDWADIQLLLGGLTETERQLVLKTARDLAEDYYKTQQLDIKDYFPRQEPHWSLNRTAELEKLRSSRMDSKRGGKGHSQNPKLVSFVCGKTGSFQVTIRIPGSSEGCNAL